MFLLVFLALGAVQDKSSDQILTEAESLMADARKLYDTGKTQGILQDIVDAGFKADEARAKYQAIQQITQGENQKKAAAGVREANQLIKLVNDARVALKKPAGAPPPAAPPPPGAPAPAPKPVLPPPPDKKPPAGPVVDLLKMLVAERDIVNGKWMIQPAKVLLMEKRVKDTPIPRLEIPYTPPEEYDLRVNFRHTGNGGIYLLLSKGGSPFAFEMGGEANTVYALRHVKEPPGDPATTTVRKAKCLEGARSYTALIEVRNDGIRAYLDELLIVYTSIGSDKDVFLGADLALRRPDILGLAGANQAVFSAIELVEIKGKGKPAR